jgi:hypothetical protein
VNDAEAKDRGIRGIIPREQIEAAASRMETQLPEEDAPGEQEERFADSGWAPTAIGIEGAGLIAGVAGLPRWQSTSRPSWGRDSR